MEADTIFYISYLLAAVVLIWGAFRLDVLLDRQRQKKAGKRRVNV